MHHLNCSTQLQNIHMELREGTSYWGSITVTLHSPERATLGSSTLLGIWAKDTEQRSNLHGTAKLRWVSDQLLKALLYSSERRAAELIVGLEGISCEESLRHVGCSVWRRQILEATSLLSTTSCGGKAEREVPVSSPCYLMTGHVQEWHKTAPGDVQAR